MLSPGFKDKPLSRMEVDCACTTGGAFAFSVQRKSPAFAGPKEIFAARRLVASQLIREYIYLYGAVSPKDGTCIYLIMPTSNTACFQAFLNLVARKFAGQDILLVLDGAPKLRARR